jgi:hypothetical protein
MKTYKIRNKADGGILEVTEDQLAAFGLELPEAAKGGMIKRADGSYSRRGLWDNIRANKGSGKKPTKAMLAQEKKIRAAEKAYGGYMQEGGGTYFTFKNGRVGRTYPIGPYESMDTTGYSKGKENFDFISSYAGFKPNITSINRKEVLPKIEELKKGATRIKKQAYGGYMDMGGYMNPYMGYGGMYDMGGMYPMDMMAQGGINNPGFRALPDYVQEKIKDNMAYGGCKECGGKMQDGGRKTLYQQYLEKYPYRPSSDTLPFIQKSSTNTITDWNPVQFPSTYGYLRTQDGITRTPEESERISDWRKATKQKFPTTEDYFKAGQKYDSIQPKPFPPYDYPVPIMKTGGKLPKEVLRARLESHMSSGQAQDYLNTYGMGGYLEEAGDGKWIQKATASIKRRGTEGVCTGSKFGGPGCPPGSKRYNLAKTFRKMAKSKKEEGGYAQGGEYEMTDAEIAKLRSMGYKIKEV